MINPTYKANTDSLNYIPSIGNVNLSVITYNLNDEDKDNLLSSFNNTNTNSIKEVYKSLSNNKFDPDFDIISSYDNYFDSASDYLYNFLEKNQELSSLYLNSNSFINGLYFIINDNNIESGIYKNDFNKYTRNYDIDIYGVINYNDYVKNPFIIHYITARLLGLDDSNLDNYLEIVNNFNIDTYNEDNLYLNFYHMYQLNWINNDSYEIINPNEDLFNNNILISSKDYLLLYLNPSNNINLINEYYIIEKNTETNKFYLYKINDEKILSFKEVTTNIKYEDLRLSNDLLLPYNIDINYNDDNNFKITLLENNNFYILEEKLKTSLAKKIDYNNFFKINTNYNSNIIKLEFIDNINYNEPGYYYVMIRGLDNNNNYTDDISYQIVEVSNKYESLSVKTIFLGCSIIILVVSLISFLNYRSRKKS